MPVKPSGQAPTNKPKAGSTSTASSSIKATNNNKSTAAKGASAPKKVATSSKTTSKAPSTTQPRAATSSKPSSASANSKSPPVDPLILNAIIVFQKVFRMVLAKRRLEKRHKEKEDYESEMIRLEKEAYVYLVKMQQAEAERKRQLEEDERRRIAEHNRRRTRMLEAAFDGDINECQKILKEVADLDTKNGLGHDVIGTALRNRHQLEMINCRDANANTPLMEAASGGSVEVVNYLIERGADVNGRGQFMRSPLYRAAYAGHVDVVQILLSSGADPRLYDEQALTPVDVSHDEVVKEILKQWNIEETEKMMTRIQHFRKQREEEEAKRHEAEMSEIMTRIQQAEKQMEIAKSRLNKSYDEREKRIHEHDLAVLEGYQRLDVTEQLIHDAEFEVENAKLDFKKATEKLSLLKLELREKRNEGKQNEGGENDDQPGIHCHVKDLDDVLLRDVGNRISSSGKWPVVVDTSGQATTFLRYRDTNFINALNPDNRDENRVRIALLGAIRYGKPFVLDMMEVDLYKACCERFDLIIPNLMKSIVDRSILKPDVYLKLIRPGDGPEYDKNNFMEQKVKQFMFVLLTTNPFPSDKILSEFLPVWVELKQ